MKKAPVNEDELPIDPEEFVNDDKMIDDLHGGTSTDGWGDV